MKSILCSLCGLFCFALPFTVSAQDVGSELPRSGPVLAHEPISVAVAGEPLIILTRVAAVGSPVRSVTLNYSLSKDGSPISVPMALTDQGVYLGTIPASHFKTANAVWYYIEAVDASEEWTETPWHEILVQHNAFGEPSTVIPPTANPQTEASSVVAREPVVHEKKDSRILSPKVLTAGAIVVGAGVIAAVASSSGGSSGGGATTSDPTDTSTTMLPPTTDTTRGLQCIVSDVIGTWTGLNPESPRFTLARNSTALFNFSDGEVISGSWTLGPENCVIRLMPSAPLTSTNNAQVYQGSGTIRTDGTPFTVSINGRSFQQTR